MKDLKDQRFGQLTVIGDFIPITNTRNRQERKWLCRCDCGKEMVKCSCVQSRVQRVRFYATLPKSPRPIWDAVIFNV